MFCMMLLKMRRLVHAKSIATSHFYIFIAVPDGLPLVLSPVNVCGKHFCRCRMHSTSSLSYRYFDSRVVIL